MSCFYLCVCWTLLLVLSWLQGSLAYGEAAAGLRYQQRFGVGVGPPSNYRAPPSNYGNSRPGQPAWPPGKGAFSLAAKRGPYGPDFALNMAQKSPSKLDLPNYRGNAPPPFAGGIRGQAYKK